LGRKMPITSFCFFVGALALAGLPPFNGFQSKLALFVAGAGAGDWWAVLIGMLGSILTLVVLVKAAKNIFWGRPSAAAAAPRVREAPITVAAAMTVLAILCMAIGIYPSGVYRPLDRASAAVQTISVGRNVTALRTASLDHHSR